jgi:gamma-glutamylaminecyclotransferase
MYRYVFIYGTLKRGQPNNFLINDIANGSAIFIADGKTEKKYPLIIASKCNRPYLLPIEGKGEVNQYVKSKQIKTVKNVEGEGR